MNKITVITTSTGRPWCFTRLTEYMATQHLACRWLVVGEDHSGYNFDLARKIEGVSLEVIKRKPKKNEAIPSICLNWQTALKQVDATECVIVMEDDDFYSPSYLRAMWAMSNSAPLLGLNNDVYYNVRSRRWQRMRNISHCSLAMTGFNAEVVPLLTEILKEPSPFIDLSLWDRWTGAKHVEENNQDTPEHVGLKGCPGVAGCGSFHGADLLMCNDASGKKLCDWIGKGNAGLYLNLRP